MSKLYDDVKKQKEQIDDLQKTVNKHDTRIETLETKGMATPPPAQPVNQGSITVKLPDDIATNKSIGKLLDERLPETSTDDTLKIVMEQLPGSLAKGVADILSDNLGVKVKDALYEGFRREFADERKKLYDVVSELRYKAQSIIWGQWWKATPHWVYILFATLLLASGGFGYGFFYQLNENSKLKDVEWLYRYERLWWKGKEQEDLLRREKIFAVGTQQEQDSVRTCIRQYEKARHIEDTFLYFNPSEK